MPGFNLQNGNDKYQVSATGAELNRTHRWRIKTLCAQDGKSIISNDTLVYAKSLTLPSFAVEEESVMGGSLNYKFAKNVVWDDVKVAFYDVVGARLGGTGSSQSILSQIESGKFKVWGPIGGLKPADNYKGDSIFILTDGDGNSTWSFTLKNSWIKGVSHSDMTYESSSIKEVTLTISYDWAEEGDETDNVDNIDFSDKPRETKREPPYSNLESFLVLRGYPGADEPSGDYFPSKAGPGSNTPRNTSSPRPR